MAAEAHIERTVCKYARSTGWLAFKWSAPGTPGVPDRLFFRATRLLMVEFKAPGKAPTALQSHIHRQLRKEGFEVHVIDNVEDGRRLFA